MEKVVNVARYIYKEYKRVSHNNIEDAKLQKLLYFVQRESIAITGLPMFGESLWCEAAHCEIQGFLSKCGLTDGNARISDTAKYVVNNVIQEYGSLESWKLSEMLYRETSWQNAHERLNSDKSDGVPLSLDDIRADAKKVRPYDYVWDMYYDEFEDAD